MRSFRRFMTRKFILAVCMSVGGVAAPAWAQQGETLASDQLKADALRQIMILDMAYGGECKTERRVLRMEITKQPEGLKVRGDKMMAGKWGERWTIDRCGQPIAYDMTFTADGRGGTFISTKIASEHMGASGAPAGVDSQLLSAVEEGNRERIEELLAQNANIEVTDHAGRTVLMVAALKGKAEAVKVLLTKGSNAKATTKGGLTPLHLASNSEVVRLLVAAGADIHQKDADDRLPLMYACGRGNLDAVQTLLEMGADVNARDMHGVTPLILAIEPGHVEVARLLLEKGADPGYRHPKTGGAALHFTAVFGKVEIARALLEHGTDVNVPDSKGDTPLILAARFNQIAAVRLFLEKGANVAWKNHAGHDAEKDAAKGETKNLLKEAKKKQAAR